MKKYLVVSLVAALVGSVLVLGPSAFGQSPGYRVIVNSSNPADEISKDLLSSYLLKKKSRWDHGITVEPADLDSRSQTRVALSEDVHGRSVASIKNYWQRQIFSGRNVPPPEVSSDSEMIAFVSSNAGGIGYVSASANLSGVKSIRVVN